MDKYEDLRILEDLRSKGSISEEEFRREKDKILNSPYQAQNQRNNFSGMEENTYLTLMHLSQLAGFIIAGLGFVIPIVMWLTNAGKSEAVDRHGKNIANFMLSMLIYVVISLILCILLIGIPILIVLGILEIVFIIIAAVKANNGEYWKYPLSISFFT
jgi:uncharacterized Tic20 family protein